MRNNNRITKPTIRIDIQLFTLHLIGICFHLNISLLNIDKTWNQQDKTRWKNKTETFSSRLNASYQFDDNNSLGASFSFLRNPKLIIDGETEGSVLRRPHKGGHVFCVRHLQS